MGVRRGIENGFIRGIYVDVKYSMAYTKRFVGAAREQVTNEVDLQREGAEYGVSPCILDTDNETFITMEDLEEMNIADLYGEDIQKIPDHIKKEIWNILWILFSCAGIEYIDVTPYNFIQKDGRLWVVDYGHARKTQSGKINQWLLRVLSDPNMTISEWNSDFA